MSSDFEMAAKYEEVLTSIRDEYFVVADRNVPQTWLANEKVRNLIRRSMRKRKRRRKSDLKCDTTRVIKNATSKFCSYLK